MTTVGILSIGEMGMGIAKLLIANNYRVVSQDTQDRAHKAHIETLPTDVSLVTQSDYILSIVPPGEALATATRITAAFNAQPTPKTTPLYFLDLNAISPRSAREIASLFSSSTPSIRFVDGGIIGGPPSPKSNLDPLLKKSLTSQGETSRAWKRPSIPVSGQHKFDSLDAPESGAHFAEVLNLNHISDDIGVASGLKCCFASATKGFTALCIQAFTTANNLVPVPVAVPDLTDDANMSSTVPPKAYRWVREMEEIAETHADEGGFNGDIGIFGEIAKVYRSVADDTALGEEKTERRKRGLTIEDVASAMGDGSRAKKRKTE
ncbi:hypothetical protein D0Z07_2578 [Hyphodiscus hymeniophilus]|uniref:6-phosphogluconate dehydrogenase C-terminal domain-like protein n=1 Tax=Hyphodiscus hymeniophilus TaxID=353542 RepID=A0A9P6VN61_9HELO|nr:hypothetical protein D0Z07_2578 [Hyphodiscus hymeniophilus]